MSLLFGGATSDRVNHGAGASIGGLSAFTMLSWVYPTDVSGTQMFASKGAATDYKNFHFWNTATMRLVLKRATTDLELETPTGFITANEWQFVATRVDANGDLFDQKLLRGTLSHLAVEPVSYLTRTLGSGSVPSDASEDLYVGNYPQNPVLALVGRIAWFGLWNRALSVDEIRRQQFAPSRTAGCVLFVFYTHPDVPQRDLARGNNGVVTGAVGDALDLELPQHGLQQRPNLSYRVPGVLGLRRNV